MILYIRIQEFDLLIWLFCRGSRSSREFGSKGFSLGYQDIAKEDMGTVGVEEAD
jgi:predicted alpha/beta hydrolase